MRKDEKPIFLVGFMGAGKTTVGQILARRLGYAFLDLDSVIENRAGKTVQQIFAEQGEREFRRLEREAIGCCRELKNSVIALGGGAFVSEENRKTLGEIGVTVWLDCPLEICLERVGGDGTRPLLGGATEMRSLHDRRRPAYALADYVAQTGACSPEEVALEITRLLRR
ncbi:MAG TPA: shikimate kinase [Blastocatellia bacterium]|nr:shikimate kinase [Blastocatellia bacterium]